MKMSVDLTVADVEASAAFYRAVGVDVPEAWKQNGVAHHVEVAAGLMLNSRQLTGSYTSPDTAVILIFNVDDRASVDAKHDELVRAGYRSHLPPMDAFWGSRYAIVDDPDGNHVGIMSPQDRDHETVPGL